MSYSLVLKQIIFFIEDLIEYYIFFMFHLQIIIID